MKGIITKIDRGIYYIDTEKGKIISKARGNFREENIKPLVGDYVDIRIAEEDLKGYIEYVYPRKNFLIRPPVANIDLVIFVVSIEQPLINLYYVDKYLSVLAVKNLEVAICFNKIDLVSHEKVEYYKTLYEKAGYNVIVNSNLNFENKSLFKELLKNKTTVIGGPSGVGKTSLINSLNENLSLMTNKISNKTQRDRHTTRTVEIYEIFKSAYILDTPGFTSLDMEAIDERELSRCFREIYKYGEDCKFRNCLHENEPECNVKAQLEKGNIFKTRYENYKMLIRELRERRRH